MASETEPGKCVEESQRTAAALIIGDELLSGKVSDANIPVLARTLRRLGVVLDRVLMLPDTFEILVEEVRKWSARRDWVFTSGGVGPTHDDLTVDAIAAAFEVPVVSSPQIETLLREYYGDKVTAGHLRMARVPHGAQLVTVAPSPWPTVVMDNVWILPGVPQIFAMKMPVVAETLGVGLGFVSERLFTLLDEGLLKPLLDAVVAAHPEVSIGSYPKWRHPHYKTQITFDGCDANAVTAARSDLLERLPKEAVVEAQASWD
jgi:molybdenum cofactor synthesis domain-containing protein